MKRKRAIALKYDRNEDQAPVVVAKGEGKIADRIVEIAREKGIFIKEDPLLADLLIRVPLKGEIPPALYRAVAEVIAFIYQKAMAR